MPLISSGMNSGYAVQDRYSIGVESSVELDQDNLFPSSEKSIHTILFDNHNTFYIITKECYQGEHAVELQSPPPEIK